MISTPVTHIGLLEPNIKIMPHDQKFSTLIFLKNIWNRKYGHFYIFRHFFLTAGISTANQDSPIFLRQLFAIFRDMYIMFLFFSIHAVSVVVQNFNAQIKIKRFFWSSKQTHLPLAPTKGFSIKPISFFVIVLVVLKGSEIDSKFLTMQALDS